MLVEDFFISSSEENEETELLLSLTLGSLGGFEGD